MTRPLTVAALAALAVVLLTFPAHARPARPFLEAHGGWGSYSMDDVNDEIHAINAEIAPLGLDEINGGGNFGGELGLKFPSGFALGFAYDRLTGSTSVADPTGSLEYDLPANVFRITGERVFRSSSKVSGRLGASLGVVSEVGTIRLAVTGGGAASGDVRGTSGMGEIFGGFELAAAPQCDLSLDAGYRDAKATDIEVEGQPAFNAAGDPYSVDFSGFFVRAGVRLMLAR